jgi:hypothetical protein
MSDYFHESSQVLSIYLLRNRIKSTVWKNVQWNALKRQELMEYKELSYVIVDIPA